MVTHLALSDGLLHALLHLAVRLGHAFGFIAAREAACLRKLADMLRRRTLGACRGLFQGLVRMAESGATKRAAKRKAAAT